MGFPGTETMESAARKTSAPQQDSSCTAESVPIRVLHEKLRPASAGNVNNNNKHKYASTNKTTDLPSKPTCATSEQQQNSPRVTRSHSEPPKAFNQRLMKTKIPLGGLAEQNEDKNNLATSASEPSVPRPDVEQQPPPQAPPRKTQATKSNSSNLEPAVRHIPIFVEGRDKPVINKESQQASSSTSSFARPAEFYPSNTNKVEKEAAAPAPRRSQAPPTHLNVNKDKKVFTEPTSPLSPIPSDQPIPMGYNDNASSSVGAPDGEPTSPQPLPSGPIPMPCSSDFMGQSTTTTADQSDSGKNPSQNAAASVMKEPEKKLDSAMEKLSKVQEAVEDLVKQLEAFKGYKNSKEYKLLDEMLTRNLLILDGIETEGREDIRQQRKESIKSINRCLSILESKASGQQAEMNNEILSELAAKSKKC
jgi:hypothetical protein